MKNAYAVLEEKEADLARVRLEIESLRVVASLLEKTDDLPDLEATGTDSLFSSVATTRSSLWKALKRAR
ncbi:MAG: hypothetical protein JWN74_1404 [Acidobacteriaceae bacterium]|nr:hypothetical protein [Acidobacteriaceae bacterium]